MTVEDLMAPVAIAQDVTIALDVNGAASITASEVNNGSSDNCAVASISVSPNVFACSEVGSNVVVLTVTDVNGNVSTTNANVEVIDTIAPVALCQDVVLQLDVNGEAVLTAAMADAGSNDACGIGSLSVSQSVFGCAHIGSNAVTLTVVDVNGNESYCDFNVTVNGIIPSVSVAQSELPAFCLGAVVELTATSAEAISYDWSTGDNTSVAQVSEDGDYIVTVTSATNCSTTDTFTVSGFDAGSLISAYGILAKYEVHLHGQQDVVSGGVGVIKRKRKAKIQNCSHVAEFVQAPRIDVSWNSSVGAEIEAPADVILPTHVSNPFGKAGAKIKVGRYQTEVLTESVYEEVKVDYGATVIFTQSTVYVRKLEVKRNGIVKFSGCSNLILDYRMKLDRGVAFNPDGDHVVVYIDGDVHVKEGSEVNARIYSKGDIHVHGNCYHETLMNGQFIADKIHGHHWVTWSLDSSCDECEIEDVDVPSDPYCYKGKGKGKDCRDEDDDDDDDDEDDDDDDDDDRKGKGKGKGKKWREGEGDFAEATSLSITPNPATEFVNLNLSSSTSLEAMVTITDVTGRVVYQGQVQLTGGYAQETIELVDGQPGVYRVTYVTDQEVLTETFVRLSK